MTPPLREARVSALEGVRWWSFLAVFCLHRLSSSAVEWTRAIGAPGRWIAGAVACGGRGVDVFCALSGYLITRLLLDERARTGRIDVGRFYARRALRLLPLYLATIAVTELVAARLLHRAGLGEQRAWFLALAGNVSSALHGYPSSAAFPLWSVSLEAQAYLLWPFLLGRTEATTHATIARRFALLVGVAFASRALLLALSTPEPAMWCLLPCRIDLFAAGGLVALAPRVVSRARSFAAPVAVGSLAAMIALSTLAPAGARPTLASTAAYLPAMTCAAAALALALEAPSRWLVARPAVALGRVSYGLYALHVPAIALVRALAPQLSMAIAFAISLATTVAAAHVSWDFFEAPILRWKARFAT